MKALRLPNDIVRDAGLGYLNSGGRQTDVFRGRILFPIFDANGDPVGFGGRIMPGEEGPKYKNTPETALYQKSKLLYALNWSKTRIVTDDRAIVCEGYTDVIGFARAGIPAAVATCGTALTEEHIRLMKRFAPRVVLAFDADAAGQNAAERFYEWEQKYEVDVAVAALPPGVDPGDLAQRDPEALKHAIEQAVPFLGFRVRRALAAGDLRTPEGRARTAENALAVIREHPSALVRDQYIVEVADRTRAEPDQLRAALDRPGRNLPSPPRPGRRPGADEHEPESEMEALRLLANHRDETAPELHEVLFRSERTRAAYAALVQTTSIREAIEAADLGAAELLAQVAVEEPEADVVDVVSRMLEARVNEAIAELERESRSLGSVDDRWAHLAEEQAWLLNERMRLRAQTTDRDERGELVAFLAERSATRDQSSDEPVGEIVGETDESQGRQDGQVQDQPIDDGAPPPEDPGEEIE